MWPPYPYGSPYHWLWGWATRIQLHFADDITAAATNDDWIVFHPCAESIEALDELRPAYPIAVSRITEAWDVAYKSADRWARKPTDANCAKYHSDLLRLSRLILDSVQRIAVHQKLEISSPPNDRQIVTRAEIAKHLGVSSGRISQRVKAGTLPAPFKTVGKTQYFWLDEVNKHLAENKNGVISFSSFSA